MKRDMSLIRDILIAIEDVQDANGRNPIVFRHDWNDQARVVYHLQLLIDAGLVIGTHDGHATLRGCFEPYVKRMTMAGHDYLESIRRFVLPEPEPSESKLSKFNVGDGIILASNPVMRGTIIGSGLYQIGDHLGLLHTVKWEASGDVEHGIEDHRLRKVDKPMAPSRAVDVLNANDHLGCTDWRLDRPFLNDVVHGCWPMQQRSDDMRIPAEEAVRRAEEYLKADKPK